MRKFLTSILTMISISLVHGQSKAPFDISVGVGAGYFKIPNLEKMIKNADANKLPPIGLSLAFDFEYRFKHINLGLNTSGTAGFTKSNTLTSGMTSIYVSTNIIRFNKIILSPAIGFGPQYNSATITKENLSGSFEEFLTSKSTQTVVNQVTSGLDFGLTLKTFKDDRIRPQVKIGYQMGLKNQHWEIDKSTITGAPSDKVGTYYLQLVNSF